MLGYALIFRTCSGRTAFGKTDFMLSRRVGFTLIQKKIKFLHASHNAKAGMRSLGDGPRTAFLLFLPFTYEIATKR